MNTFEDIDEGIQHYDSGDCLWLRRVFITGRIFGMFIIYADHGYEARQVYLCHKEADTDYFNIHFKSTPLFFKL